MKARSRHALYDSEYGKIGVSRHINTTLVNHFSPADLCMFSDFPSFKKELDILSGSFVTMGSGGIKIGDHVVVIRDTILLAPGGAKALTKIGETYGIPKLSLTSEELNNMKTLRKEDESKFVSYAFRDTQITLTHASWMEAWHFENTKSMGVPLTLAGVGKKFLLLDWESKGYKGYQLNPEFIIGDASQVQTPYGLHEFDFIGHILGYFIANYKGGMNISFMYGIDKTTYWKDYDLTSAYSTILSSAGHPDYANASTLTEEKLGEMSSHELVFSYTVIDCKYQFPSDTKFPTIVEYLNESSVVFPLEGKAVLTGSQYLVARNQGCKFEILSIYSIPFKKVKQKGISGENTPVTIKPFSNVIDIVQKQRKLHAKKSMSNLMYKEIANGLYGAIVRGMSDKRKYNNKTGEMFRMPAHELTNPIIAS